MAQYQTGLACIIGASVQAIDGSFGHLHAVILNSHLDRVVALVVRSGLLPLHDTIVPMEQVADATDAHIVVRARRAELAHQLAFDPAHYLEFATSGTGAAALARTQLGALAEMAHQGRLGLTVVLRRNDPVLCSDGRAGRIRGMRLTSAGRVRSIVVHRVGRSHSAVLVPMAWVRYIEERGVWIAAERAALDHLPIYRPDDRIAADIEQALWNDEVVRALDISEIDIAVAAGVVTLSGYAATPISKARAARAAGGVAGVLDVVNQIVADSDVAGAVAQALALDTRTRGQPVLVQARHGMVTLSGAVASATVRSAAEACAAGVPLVRAVVNTVQAPGVAVAAADQRALQPGIGQVVHATDAQLGRVTWVIINPRNRRVTAIVVHGQFLDPASPTPPRWPEQMPRQERHVVIPIDAVANMTDTSMLLNITSYAAARYPDLDRASVAVPAQDWTPPYPYRQADVLIAGCADAPSGTIWPPGSDPPLADAGDSQGVANWQQLSRGMPVRFCDGGLGTIDHLWIDSYHRSLGAIVVRLATPPHQDLVVPFDPVRAIDELGALTDMDSEQVELLPAAQTAPALEVTE
jgi:osmotically-inducible protein OsmY/uncharacterized protein YrrD